MNTLIRLMAITALMVSPAVVARPPAPIIDVHLHAHPPAQFLAHRPGAPDECALPTSLPALDVARSDPDLATAYFHARLETCPHPLHAAKDDADLQHRTLDALNRHNVTAIASSDFENVQRWQNITPARIIPGLLIYDPKVLDLSVLRGRIEKKQVQVLGEVVSQYAGLLPSDPALDPLFSLAEELDVPVVYHVGLSAPGVPAVTLKSFRAGASHPLDFESVLKKHPKLRLCIAHAGWPMGDEMLQLLWSYPQVYVDISVLDWILPRREFHAYLQRLVEAGFGSRILFGSDQMAWPDAIDVAIENVEAAKFLTPAQKRDIFYNNAVRFLRLRTETKAT